MWLKRVAKDFLKKWNTNVAISNVTPVKMSGLVSPYQDAISADQVMSAMLHLLNGYAWWIVSHMILKSASSM